MAYFKQSRNVSLTKQRTFLHCKYVCKNSSIDKPQLFISGSSVQGDWKLQFHVLLTEGYSDKPQPCVLTAARGLKINPGQSLSAEWGEHSKSVYFQKPALSSTHSSESMSALVMFILLTLIFPTQQQLPSCCIPTALGKFPSTAMGWVCLWPSSPSIFWPKNTSNINQNNLHASFALKYYFHAEPYKSTYCEVRALLTGISE